MLPTACAAGNYAIAHALDTLRAGLVVADVVVSPPRTAFLRAAEERGARTLDGLGMLVVSVGAAALGLWIGRNS